MSKADFAARSLDELLATLCEKYSLKVPTLDLANVSVKQSEADIDVSHDWSRGFSTGGRHYVKGTVIDVRVPFLGDPGMFNLKLNTWTTSIPRGRVEGNSVRFTISGTDLAQQQVKADIDHRIAEIQEWLGFQQQSLGNFTQELAQTARQALEARKKKLDADSSLISGLGYRVE